MCVQVWWGVSDGRVEEKEGQGQEKKRVEWEREAGPKRGMKGGEIGTKTAEEAWQKGRWTQEQRGEKIF